MNKDGKTERRLELAGLTGTLVALVLVAGAAYNGSVNKYPSTSLTQEERQVLYERRASTTLGRAHTVELLHQSASSIAPDSTEIPQASVTADL